MPFFLSTADPCPTVCTALPPPSHSQATATEETSQRPTAAGHTTTGRCPHAPRPRGTRPPAVGHGPKAALAGPALWQGPTRAALSPPHGAAMPGHSLVRCSNKPCPQASEQRANRAPCRHANKAKAADCGRHRHVIRYFCVSLHRASSSGKRRSAGSWPSPPLPCPCLPRGNMPPHTCRNHS